MALEPVEGEGEDLVLPGDRVVAVVSAFDGVEGGGDGLVAAIALVELRGAHGLVVVLDHPTEDSNPVARFTQAEHVARPGERA